MFIDASKVFSIADFKQYNKLIDLKCHEILLEWWQVLADGGVK